MLKLFIHGRNHRTNANALYDEESGKTTVLKGSVISENLSNFGNTSKILALRVENVKEDGVLKKNVVFDNPSLAAQFVCGYSVSGPVAWHLEKHKNLLGWMKENRDR